MDRGRDFLNKTVTVKIDRPLGSLHPKHNFLYLLNYGYVPNTKSGDGEELDAYILGEFKPLDTFTGKVLAVIERLDENDDKLVVAKDGKNYSDEQIEALVEFQEQWKRHKIVRS